MTDFVDMEKNKKIQNMLLGRSGFFFEQVIITPIESAYFSLLQKLSCYDEIKTSFFLNACFKVNDNASGILICVPQGIGAQDIMYALFKSNVIFFGFCGSFNSLLQIGKVVEVDRAIDENGGQYLLAKTGKFPESICGYSPCLLGEIAKKYTAKARSLGCNVIDMETVYCAKAAIINSNEFIAWLLITDIPGEIELWNIDEDTRRLSNEGYNKALDVLANYVQKQDVN